MGNVDNVDKKVDYFLLETINCRKYKENIWILRVFAKQKFDRTLTLLYNKE